MTHLERINKHAKAGYWSLIFWLPMLAVAGMAFDAPNSQSRVFPWAFLAIVLLIPVFVLFGPRNARKALDKGRVKTAYVIVLIPQVLILAPMIIAPVIGAIGIWNL